MANHLANHLANIVKQNEIWRISGAVVLPQVEVLLSETKEGFTGARLTIDFSEVEAVDTSTLSLLLEWLRKAKSAKCDLRYQNLPKNLVALATLYGVLEMIPTATSH